MRLTSSQARAGVFEFLLVNHPLDCPVCDKGGECPLQDFSYDFGPAQSRTDFPRRVFDGEGVKGDVDFGPTLMLNRQRCILCTRCVRFMRDVEGDAQINIIDRGYGSEIATFQEEGVHSLISGNLMDVCPVGAITTRDYRFKSRPWDNPTAIDTICTRCEKGCNTTAWLKAKPEWAKGSRLIRFTPRFTPDVNGYWMCDIGRFDYHWIESDDRLRKPLMRDGRGALQPVSWHDLHREPQREAVRRRADERRRRSLSAVSARVARRAVSFPPAGRRARRQHTRHDGDVDVVGEVTAGGHEVRRARDRCAERRRRSRVWLRPTTSRRSRPRSRRARSPRCTCSIRVRRRSATSSGLSALAPTGTLPLLIVQGVLMTPLAAAADFVLPGASSVEKEASYTNGQGRLQAAARALPLAGDAMEDWQILVNVARGLGVALSVRDAAAVRADIDVRFARIGRGQRHLER